MKVCILQADYSTTSVDYKNYDPPRDLLFLLQEHEVDHIFLNKLTTYKQLQNLAKKNYDIFINLCEGYLDWEVPSIDVIHSLELLNLPYTGPSALLYDPSKILMKYVADCAGVKTPNYFIVNNIEDVATGDLPISFPMFVKPSKAGDSLGIDDSSLVHDRKSLVKKISYLLPFYSDIMVEEYIAGREFTVLVSADPLSTNDTKSYKPIEYIFPEGKEFKTYSLKTYDLHGEANIPCNNPALESQLRKHSIDIFKGFNGVGYARLDFRVNELNHVYFLEINFTCSVFYKDGYEGSADYILKHDPDGQRGFLLHIIKEGIHRHQLKQKKYQLLRNSISGYGIYARQDIMQGDIIFQGEGRPQRIISKKYMEEHWTEEEKKVFKNYAYPISNEVYILWDSDPKEWAPQNHSCMANCHYEGLNVVASVHIKAGEELTLDYSYLLNDYAESFDCTCNTSKCKGKIQGKKNNSISTQNLPKAKT
ncbi:MAG: SET domain-containing protein-lysine N-methyltransferase [Saprospiraceae bacterium]|nr:SET domain-containing protein-lysine N-methyltransferase [Saprospiraceae bacterium]